MARPNSVLTSLRAVPGPRGLPLLGNLLQIIRLRQFHRTLEDWAVRYGPIYQLRIGRQRIAVVSDRDAIQRTLVQRPNGFRRTQALRSALTEMRLNGVFAAESDDWRRQRRIVVAALSRARISRLFSKLNVTVERLRRRWERAAERGEVVDPCRDLMRATVDVTMQLAFGVDANTLETPGPVIQRHLDKVFPKLYRRINAPFAYWRYVRLPSDRALDRALREIESEVAEMLRAARQRLAANPERRRAPTDFLEAILADEAEDSGFSDSEIFANAGTLLLAGEDTTANTMAWAIHYFIRYPEHFARARREADEILAPAPVVERVEQTGKLPFLDAFCNEVMRLKPVGPIFSAEAIEDVSIHGCLIPKGTQIMMPIRRMAMQDENFAAAERFDPDRWLTPADAGHGPHDTRAFVPFGGGKRLCPGRNLALLQIRTVLPMLCRNFDLEPASADADVAERLEFTMAPVNVAVRLKKRAGV